MARAVALLLLIVAVATTINAAPSSCGLNEVYSSCGSSCQSTCEHPQPPVCTLACIPGCYCVDGYVRNSANRCVPLQSC